MASPSRVPCLTSPRRPWTSASFLLFGLVIGSPCAAWAEASPFPAASPPPAPAAPAAVESPASQADSPFHFGGYGRVVGASDLDGGRGRPANVVPWGPRLGEGNYLELDFAYRAFEDPSPQNVQVDTLVTLAVGEPFFHDSGDFTVSGAIRQALVEARNVAVKGSFVWVGSRMYRGDDIYLFDFWPLDDLNTLGGGVGWRGPDQQVALHVGVTRPEDPFEVQRIKVPAPVIGATEAVVLDRQRTIVSLQGEQRFGGGSDEIGLKVKLHAELQRLPSGTRHVNGSISETTHLPDDLGYLAGAEVGLWNFGRNSFANLFLRYAGGLAAYGTWETPTGVNKDRRAIDARELRAGLSGNFENDRFGVMFGGWARAFRDGDAETEDFDDRVEAAVSARPMLFIGRYFTPGVEVSHQLSWANGLNPRTLTQEAAHVTQVALLPALTFGKDPVGTYTRPQIRLIYSLSFLDKAALARYPADDPRASQGTVQFLGMGAEWWFGRGESR